MLVEPWHIQLLGGLRLQQRDATITRFKTQKIAGLLAYLAFHLRQAHPRDVLIDLFWPESDPEAGRGSLSVALSSLRNQLEPPGTPASAVLRADRFSVSLNPKIVTTDVAEFETALRAASRAGNATERMQSLERAVDHFRGRLLPGMYEEWIMPEEARLAGLFLDAVTELLTLLEQQGDHSTALRYARQAVSVDPQREEAHGHLIRLLASAGQPDAALRQYKELERLLEEGMGQEPSQRMRALARQIEKQSGLTASAVPVVAEGHPVSPPLALHSLPAQAGQPVTLTFLLTDVAGAAVSPERTAGTWKATLAAHHALLRKQFVAHGGQAIKEAGDGFVVAFQSAQKALACAVSCQQASAEQHPEGTRSDETGSPLSAPRVRMALHTGDVELVDGEYRGLALHGASRILTAAHGGQILLSQATTELIRRSLTEEIRLVDLGLYRVRDVSTPERLHQVDYPGMPLEGFPAPAAVAGQQARLPVQVTRFFGREPEIAQLTEMLDLPKSKIQNPKYQRLITLTGPGGTGKSRLAIEVAERLAEAYRGAIWFVGLADLTDAALIGGAILDALRLPRSPQREPLEQVAEALSRQPSLLVLDNYEHLVEKGADLVQTLLQRVPSLAVLVTSRQLLGLSGEREFAVPPLTVPNGGESPEQLSLFESVALFVDRAQAALPYFQVSNANAPAVAELCQRLEGIPLAIELAAARAQVLTPAQMLAQLSNRYEFLTSRKRGVEERHRTLRAAVEWSYRLLAPELQRFFCRLSVFRGGWTAEAAEAVCEEPLALDYLAQLRECSLSLSEETAQGMRFRMLETIREYAHERLADATEVGVCGNRHADYFLGMALQAQPKLQGPEQAVWLERLESEHDNLRTALSWRLRSANEERESGEAKEGSRHRTSLTPPTSEASLHFCAALYQFWSTRGHLSEGRAWCDAALKAEGAQGPTGVRAMALNAAGGLAYYQCDYAAAGAYHAQSLEIFREIGDKKGIANSLNGLGNVAKDQSDYAAARAYYEQSLENRREIGDKAGIANSLGNLGTVDDLLGNHSAARAYYQQNLEMQREIGDRQGMASPLNNLGTVASSLCDYAAARGYFEQSLEIYQELGDKKGIGISLNNLGSVAKDQSDYVAARAYLEQSLEILRELGDRRGIARSLGNLAYVALCLRDLAAARAYYEQSLDIQREIGDRYGISDSLVGLGDVAHEQGDYAAARTHFEQSLEIQREIGHKHGIANSLDGLGMVAERQGEYTASRAYLEQSLEIFREIGDRLGFVASLNNFARLGFAEALAATASVGTATTSSHMADGPRRAARLWGAAEVLREELRVQFAPSELDEYERQVAEVREAMGEEAFTAAWEAGRAMTWEQAVAYALEGRET